ncbi:MAG: YesL family protein [Clostridiales bacterium]|nr:YesL family protein [Clostridiales bacterium]
MASFFSQKHPATIFLTAVCNLIFVNFCFVITCVPIITIGASLTAMNRITIKILLGENPPVFSEYFRSFKNNFKQSTVIWLILAGITGFFVWEIYLINTALPPEYTWTQYPIYFLLFAVFSCMAYAFPIIAWFDETNKQVIKNSLLLSLANIPSTIFFAIITLALGLVTYVYPVLVLSLMCFLGFALVAILESVFLKRIFEKAGAKLTSDDDEEGDALDEEYQLDETEETAEEAEDDGDSGEEESEETEK